MKKNRHSPATKAKLSSCNDIWFPWKDRFVAAAIVILPFFVLYWLVPFVGKYSIGQDYQSFWIRQQLYLQFSIRNGTFPLYAPGFVGGWTASALTLGQLWHPISWVASRLPDYWSGHAFQIGTLYRLFSLGVTNLVLFLFLRRLRLTTVLALVISFITVYNLRMLDMFRYAAALENYVGYLLLCVAISWHYITATKRLGPFCIAVSTWLLVVGGHPQIMYFGLLAAAIICLFIPFYMKCLLPDEVSLGRRKIWAYYLSVGLSVTVGFLLASPYWLSYYFEYLPETWRNIAGASFRWACGYQDTLRGGLSNLFTPFYSDVHGAFGGSALVLLVVLMPLLFLMRVRVPLPVLGLWLVCIFTFVMMLGSNGPLYYYFWKYFPLAQNFRVPGRLSLALPFMILLLLSWLSCREPLRFRIRSLNMSLSPLALLAIVAMVLFAVVNCFPRGLIGSQGVYSQYSPAKLNDIPTVAMVLTVVFGLISLAAMALFSLLGRFKAVVAVVLVAAVFLQVTATLRYGTWIVMFQKKMPTFEKMGEEQREWFAYRKSSGYWSKSVLGHLQRTFLEPTLARVCRKYTVVASRQEAYVQMARERSADHILVENYPITGVKGGGSSLEKAGIDRVKLTYNSFNNLKFDVTCAQPAFFVFSFPYSEHWRAYVNGERVPVYRSNGIEQAVRLVDGKSVVEFIYWSWATLIGVGISCLTLSLMIMWLLAGVRVRLLRRIGMIATPCFFVLVWVGWYHSLYWGGNIGTDYTWTSEDFQPHLSSYNNLAYGKITAMSRPWVHCPYSKVSAVGVDGQRGPKSGFSTSIEEQAWWQVDLGQVEPITEIVIYKYSSEGEECGLPFDVIASRDGKRGFLVTTITEKGSGSYWRIRLRDVKARYIRLQMRNRGRLVMAEVEIYGPKGAED